MTQLVYDQPEAWFVVVERCTLDLADMDPYVVGPFSEPEAEEELQSDAGIVFCLLTIDAKNEGYIAHDCYSTSQPPPGSRIIPIHDSASTLPNSEAPTA